MIKQPQTKVMLIFRLTKSYQRRIAVAKEAWKISDAETLLDGSDSQLSVIDAKCMVRLWTRLLGPRFVVFATFDPDPLFSCPPRT